MEIHYGDCLDVLRGMPANSVDSVITDPPAGIGFMGKDWDRHKGGRNQWVAWLAERLAESLRVAKPGAHALVWALPRTSHWTAMAIEDAGWVIEDRVAHIFGTGFPKHKSKLKPAVEDWWLATKPGGVKWLGVDACRIETLDNLNGGSYCGLPIYQSNIYCSAGKQKPSHPFKQPSGRWPTNLVLSHHPECKPNGTKKINGNPTGYPQRSTKWTGEFHEKFGVKKSGYADADGMEVVEAFDCHPECPVAMMDEQSGESISHDDVRNNDPFQSVAKGAEKARISFGHADSGGASRFFPRFLYCPKASRKDRGEGNTHPTVKPFELMRWLCKLVTPPRGTVLDPFAGSGSTGFAAEAEGFKAILIEQSEEYIEIIKKREIEISSETPLFR